MDRLEKITADIMADKENLRYTKAGIKPLFSVHPQAKLLIIGQAPGKQAEQSGLFWNDPSGDRLRDWLGIDKRTFYQSEKIAILPMDFYFPGKGKTGDLPPRQAFAEKWHPRLIALMPDLKLTLLVGRYAQKYYLHLKSSTPITDVIKDYQHYLPDYFPLIHPSPLNARWLKKNPWFAEAVLPVLKTRVKSALIE
ncbi:MULTISPECIES: uracil-DNA glycosylase family protein [unclassified Enterococcus]|uniref:uracil-DNA glycosylase family protein n=1 Tax=unclassified Enterococcus TaxID=2608891 RepID=UPI0015571BFB|nr:MULTISPECIES: uracil-DNA glycosylase family protein [unclassified Enterococcus]MBS7576049.1 uracil-DNA glycosylase family protein [Enterococcus sp. MMGLQ5-2]MBS7583282.1 uracil-DNA glycosylase family protein [Enterococcus sp. MMGLQ5-1]NPD11142.1 uracil-DNA glycosylase family protein [Enterococcus sp. MMGLQ5-1]NPD35885.1 uracil-DNA glycosylase family protein [Enterococcus sp. MMGLQ5-2]